MSAAEADPTAAFRAAICGTISAASVKDGVSRVETPFLDRAGGHLSVYVRANGEVTDGSATLNMFRALRCYEDYDLWPHRDDFFHRYGIVEREGALVAKDPRDPTMLLRFLQGLARLPLFFEAKPIKTADDVFPIRVRAIVRPKIRSLAVAQGKTETWAEERMRERKLTVKAVPWATDFSPVNPHTIIQVVSYAEQTPAVKLSHLSMKFMPFLLAKQQAMESKLTIDKNWKFNCVLSRLASYPPSAEALATEYDVNVIEFDRLGEDEAGKQIVEILAQP